MAGDATSKDYVYVIRVVSRASPFSSEGRVGAALACETTLYLVHAYMHIMIGGCGFRGFVVIGKMEILASHQKI